MSTLSKPAGIEPLVVTPREACTLLGISNTRLYHILGSGELESYHDGRARRIPLAAIRKYIAQRLAASSGRRPRGRPRKIPVQPAAAAATSQEATAV